MKLTGCVLAITITVTFGYSYKAVDYSLLAINHLASNHSGQFQCVFFDITAEGFFDEILGDLAESSKIQHIARIVVRGLFREEHRNLPSNPSLILINPGSDNVMANPKNRMDIFRVLMNFNPTTKIVVFVDFDSYNEFLTKSFIVWTKFNNAVFIDKRSGRLRCSSLKHFVKLSGWPHPKDLFEWHKRELRDGNITFIPGSDFQLGAPTMWLNATADFLNATLIEYRGPNPKKADFSLNMYLLESSRDTKLFNSLFMTEISKHRILIPKGRPVNAIELMMLPFSWQVWILLLFFFILAEAVTLFVPKLFRNDPILTAVCGFERQSLHQAGRWEKFTLISLIILMFFITNSFACLFVSLMVNKPTIQPIKSLDDFDKHGIKILADLETVPRLVNHTVIGKYVVNGLRQLWETLPGLAMFVSQEVADLAPRFSFNFERGEPWFDVLGCEFLTEIPMYQMALRSPLLKVFQFTHLAFVEAGLYELHKRQFHAIEYYIVWGRRPRKVKESEIYLKFDDMLMAWIALGFGLSVSLVGFLGELAWKAWEKISARLWEKFRIRSGKIEAKKFKQNNMQKY